MTDVTRKAAGYIQVKLIPADRNSQTWGGWSQRWLDLLVVREDSKLSERDKFVEAWIEIRKNKSAGKPIKMWTIDAKDTVLYRCTSKRKEHAFGIQYRGKDIIYLSGNSETESQDWMKIIRETLAPNDNIIASEIAAGRLFEVSIIDNHYSASSGLFGKYGHLSARENKLIMFDHNGVNVIQEWYLHTIRKLDAFKTTQQDSGRLLSIHLGENSSTGCGVLYLYCPHAVALIESIQHTIKGIFSGLEDQRRAQQATLMSLGALHDISLNPTEAAEPLKTLTISEEIIKAKQELSLSGNLGSSKPMLEATNVEEPFVWKDNEFYDATKDVKDSEERADYTPPEEPPAAKSGRRGSLILMNKTRTNSATLELDLPDLTRLRQIHERRGSIPQSQRFKPRMSLPNALATTELATEIKTCKPVSNLTTDGVDRGKIAGPPSPPKPLSQASSLLPAVSEDLEYVNLIAPQPIKTEATEPLLDFDLQYSDDDDDDEQQSSPKPDQPATFESIFSMDPVDGPMPNEADTASSSTHATNVGPPVKPRRMTAIKRQQEKAEILTES